MTAYINLYGPPGSGKSRRLVEMFLACAEVTQPERIAAVTFTRAAAYELRGRLAKALGIAGGPQVQRKRLPWVGTIHSLCFRALGLGTANIAKLSDFAREQQMDVPTGYEDASTEPDSPYASYADAADLTDVEVMAEFLSIQRHRKILDTDALLRLDPRKLSRAGGAESLLFLARQYAKWKAARHVLDYEDLLEEGQETTLPVKVLLVDEAQDNSPLIWDTLDAWGRATELYVAAGDPWQAIYCFSGASPAMFSAREGRWETIGDSHRFGEAAKEYAGRVLWEHYRNTNESSLVKEKLDSWKGVGGAAVDGSRLILARTRALLSPLRSELLDTGTPFAGLGWPSPLQTGAGDAYRTWWKLEEGHVIDASEALRVVRQARGAPWKRGARTSFERAAKAEPQAPTSLGTLLSLLDGEGTERVWQSIPYSDYFQLVLRHHGPMGLWKVPKIRIGTIHSAKGLEADMVELVDSWASLPARRAFGPDAAEEVCVAYVAVTRHRTSLSFLPGDWGTRYPWPALAQLQR